jgi:[1-hydroxy-2-(trimethylamino)ethyl]phosphonate dioxygenase
VSVADEVLAIYGARGGGLYFGERVSITEHGLQAAWFARLESAPEPLVIAALLHDIGHLLEAVPDDLAEWTSDARHEEVGARWLAERFRPEVSEPVRLHVPAKRYLCATDADYLRQLSSASVHTLKLQGGPMSTGETRAFEREPYHREAVRVRRWDDQGKVAGLGTPPLEAYLELLNAASRAR